MDTRVHAVWGVVGTERPLPDTRQVQPRRELTPSGRLTACAGRQAAPRQPSCTRRYSDVPTARFRLLAVDVRSSRGAGQVVCSTVREAWTLCLSLIDRGRGRDGRRGGAYMLASPIMRLDVVRRARPGPPGGRARVRRRPGGHVGRRVRRVPRAANLQAHDQGTTGESMRAVEPAFPQVNGPSCHGRGDRI